MAMDCNWSFATRTPEDWLVFFFLSYINLFYQFLVLLVFSASPSAVFIIEKLNLVHRNYYIVVFHLKLIFCSKPV